MKIIVLISIILSSLTFLNCESSGSNDIPQQVFQPQTDNASKSESLSMDQDKPKLSNEEMSPLILNSLPFNLPEGYTKEQFDTQTKDVQYKGDGKWEFSILGSGISKVRLPEETVETSDTVWNIYKKEEQTKFDLRLIAYYYEKISLCEIRSIEKYNIVSENVTISERQISAELYVFFKGINNYSVYHRVQISVRNSGQVPIKGIRLQISFTNPKHSQHEKEVCEGTLAFDQNATLILEFKDEENLNYPFPDEFKFFTLSGEPIEYRERPKNYIGY